MNIKREYKANLEFDISVALDENAIVRIFSKTNPTMFTMTFHQDHWDNVKNAIDALIRARETDLQK